MAATAGPAAIGLAGAGAGPVALVAAAFRQDGRVFRLDRIRFVAPAGS